MPLTQWNRHVELMWILKIARLKINSICLLLRSRSRKIIILEIINNCLKRLDNFKQYRPPLPTTQTRRSQSNFRKGNFHQWVNTRLNSKEIKVSAPALFTTQLRATWSSQRRWSTRIKPPERLLTSMLAALTTKWCSANRRQRHLGPLKKDR